MPEQPDRDERRRWQRLKDEIKENLAELGIDKIGFASADPFWELKGILLRHRELGRESGFEEPDIEKRVHPELSLPDPRSIISIAVAYPSKLINPPQSEQGAYRGIISRSSWGEDYHRVLKDRLSRLESFIRRRVPDARMESMTDTGALVDRAVAERAGIGWSGKNCSLITPEFGSWVYLGEMISSIPFPPDAPVTEECGDCTLCLDACPTGALVGPGQLNAGRCISFATQSKEIIDDELKEKIGNRIYGCDTCQTVCPKNGGKNWTHHSEFAPDHERVKPLLKPLLTLSNKQFKAQYGHMAASWRGKKPIQRNAVIALGKFKDESAVGLLRDILMSDKRPELREVAAWSLGKIGGDETVGILGEAMQKEQDKRVRSGIGKALERLDCKPFIRG